MSKYKHKLMLIDGHALFYRAFHALPTMTASNGFPTGAIFGFLSMLIKAISDIKPSHVLVTFDVPGKTFRDELTTDYKAHRKPTPKELTMQLPKLKEILKAMDIPCYEKPGFEADDLLGIIVNKTSGDVLNIIVTGDLDLLQLINKHTQVYRFKIGFTDIQIFDEAKMLDVYGLRPNQWVDYKAIRGDSSDNIPGVPGIGEKGALDLIKTYRNLDNVYRAVDKSDPKLKPGILKKLIAGRDSAYLSQKLAQIDHKNHLEFNFDDTKLSKFDQQSVLDLLHAVDVKALDKRLGLLSAPAENLPKKVVNINNQANELIKNQEQALLAAYLLNPGRRTYETSDWNALAAQLNEKKLIDVYQTIELPLMPILAYMSGLGIKLDLEWLENLSKNLEGRIESLTKQIHKHAGMKFNIASPIQLREVLFEKLNIPVEHLRKTGKTKVLSTAAEQLEKLRDLHPIIDLIFEYRELTKLKSTYVDPLPDMVDGQHRVHTTYSQTVAATGRLSSSDPNLQNIPIRTSLGQEVRRAFIADQGFTLVSLDYSQIELRIAADFANDPEMIEIFKSGGDFHAATASRLFGVSEQKVTQSQRRDAKTINFSVLYGVSAVGLSERSDMGRSEASEFIKKYFLVFKKLKQYIDRSIETAHKQGYMTNPHGRIRYFPDIHASNWAVRSAAERAAVNMPLQSLAADIIKLAMINIYEYLKSEQCLDDCRMIMSVHDELVFEIKTGQEQKFIPVLRKMMESVYKLKVPLVVEAKIGRNWKDLEDYQ